MVPGKIVQDKKAPGKMVRSKMVSGKNFCDLQKQILAKLVLEKDEPRK